MGTRHAFGMAPPLVDCGKFEGEFVVLVVVFANVNIETITASVVERLADKTLLLFSTFAADLAVFHQFFFNLIQVFFFFCDIKSSQNGFQMCDFILNLNN